MEEITKDITILSFVLIAWFLILMQVLSSYDDKGHTRIFNGLYIIGKNIFTVCIGMNFINIVFG